MKKYIQDVQTFNREADARFQEAVKKYQFGRGGFPFRPMYVFQREDTKTDYKRGFVVTIGNNNYRFFLKKKEAYEYYKLSNY